MLTTFPPAYPYLNFNDDPNVVAFFTAYNNYAAAYLAAINALNLPIYTNLPTGNSVLTILQDGAYNSCVNNSIPYNQGGNTSVGTSIVVGLLAWVLLNLYGLPRPSLGQLVSTKKVGSLYNTWAYNTRFYNENVLTKTYNYSIANDDIYKRVATWNLYKGDGFQFTARWLKRRVTRFLTGTGGVDPGVDQTYGVSVQYQANYNILITCNSLAPGGAFIPQLADLIASGALCLPFQYTYAVVTV